MVRCATIRLIFHLSGAMRREKAKPYPLVIASAAKQSIYTSRRGVESSLRLQ
jgi:hypothetical protein